MTESVRRSAFTLLELLVALAVFSLLVVALFAVVSQVSGAWQQAQARIESRQSGRAILDYLSRELQMAQLPADRSLFYSSPTAQPQAAQLGLQFLINPPTVSASRFLNPQAAFWQIPVVGNSNGGMAEVGYFVRWDTNVAGQPRSMLCRFLAPPGDSNYFIYSAPNNWISDAIIDAVAPGVADPNQSAQSYRGWFADHVAGLWVKALDPQGNPIETNALGTAYATGAYDSRKGYCYVETNGTNVTESGYSAASTNYQMLATLPASVEVALVVLDARAASQLTSVPTHYATSTNALAFVQGLPANVRSGARIYSTRVKLNEPNGN